MNDKHEISEETPVELVDFSSASLPKYIEIIQCVTRGGVTLGRFTLKPNPGAVIGATQLAVLVQEGSPFQMEWRLPASDTIENKLMQPDDIHIHPSDTLVYKRWQRSSRMLFLAADRAFTDQILDEAFGRHSIDLRPRIGIRDSVIEGFAEAWREELQARGGGGRIQAEALATSLVVHVFRVYGEGNVNVRMAAGGINGNRLSRVLEYIDEHLSEDISLCALASVAGFSVHRFGEIFKAETNLAPHHFLIKRRVHRAKELLLASEMSIAQIAVEVGFSGQSHFTKQFRQLTGTTPLRFRLGRD